MSSSDVHALAAIESKESSRVAGAPKPEFAALYDQWFDKVTVWLHALGAPSADVEDLAQEVFLVVRRRLPDFDGRNVQSWLFRIAHRQVLRHRRLHWVKRVFRDGGEAAERLPHSGDSPLSTLETRERRAEFERLVARLSDKRRVVFLLFEIEEYSGAEIAELLDVPINTVWTRLHHARRDFMKLVAGAKQREERTP